MQVRNSYKKTDFKILFPNVLLMRIYQPEL